MEEFYRGKVDKFKSNKAIQASGWLLGFAYSGVLIYFLHHYTMGGGASYVDQILPHDKGLMR